MSILKKPFFLAMTAFVMILSCGCVNYAARNVGAYWSDFDSQDGSNQDVSSGYVVVDAVGARNGNSSSDGIGPFQGKGNGPSFSDPDVEFYEDFGDFDDQRVQETETETETKVEAETEVEAEKPKSSDEWAEIKVEAGATLSGLSESYSVAIGDIMKANELTDQHKLREGQTLFIPKSPDFVLNTLEHVKKLKDDAIARQKKAEPVKITEYAIKNGDTLWNVANAFDLDVNSLFGCNKLSETDILKVGSVIRVPNQDGIFVKVKSGQTVGGLAKQYGIFMEAIISANEIKKGATLTQGKEIFLPGAKVSISSETGGTKSAAARNAKEKVVARRGFGWPVVGKISSSYGWRRDPVRGGRDFHTGLDIRAPRGRPIVAAAAGRVVHSGWMGGYGRTIVISHPGGTTTLYGHSSKLLVGVGANVKRGQRIALVGSTGRSTGNHLHFEVRQKGRPMNPLKFIR
ncbi:MAG: LysM peptidoglycan-binding domain-containing M23 family metallopeptidase [Synergistaceae bacterium]|jgi:murein DD-endopeptidase MepM/ murein hydrolase activator NlpD|nr:LysM peptidoglycan-binding domain-containing M23 family metallopeptidase [Synergistaceae bacterium]